MGLLRWQQAAFERYKKFYDQRSIHVQIAGTGSGKTAAGSAMASYAFTRESAKNPLILVAVPFRSIKEGWQRWLKRFGISRTTINNNNAADPSLEGIICTYASLGEMMRMVLTWDRPVILVLDEFHHLEENGQWASPLVDLTVSDSSAVVRAIMLSGTPWHETGGLPTSLVQYDDNGYVVHDHIYTYGDAVNEDDEERNVVPVEFRLIDGVAHQTKFDPDSGELLEGGRSFDTQTMRKTDPLSPFFDFDCETIYQYDAALELIDRAVERLDQVRSVDGTDYAGGIFITMFGEQAKAVKRYLQAAHGKNAVVVQSDDPKAHDAIKTFSRSHHQEWIIAINMISEGVDIPRLKVLGDLTHKKTLLHVIQRWGRVLRRVRKPDDSFATNPSAYVYALNHPFLREIARQIEEEVNRAKKDKKGEGDAPEQTCVYTTERQEFFGETSIAHGAPLEARVADLAQWLWDNNWRQIREGRRGHTDCTFTAKNMIVDGHIPKGYTEPKREQQQPKKDPRSYDEQKKDAVDLCVKATAALAQTKYNGEFNTANIELNKRMGINKWSGATQPLEKIKKRTEIAKNLLNNPRTAA